MARKVKPEECPGHEWITLRSIRICNHCTASLELHEPTPKSKKTEPKTKPEFKLSKLKPRFNPNPKKGNDMKLTFETETHMKVIAQAPDEPMKKRFADSIMDAYHREAISFREEVIVAIRKLKPGEKMTLKSRPLEVDMERTLEKQPAKEEILA